METDVLVIGGGIAGASIARELSRYKVDTVLVERSESIPDGQTKCGEFPLYRGLFMMESIVAKSFILKPGEPVYDVKSRRAWQEEESWKIWHEEWLPQLDIPYKRVGVMVIATEDRMVALERMWRMGQEFGGAYADVERVDKDFILGKEPTVNKDVVAGLWSKGHHVTIAYPWDMATALLENAQQNGVRVVRGATVTSISHNGDSQVVETTRGSIKARFIVNGAGVYADRIARMVGPVDWEMSPQSGGGACVILDKEASAQLTTGENIIGFAANPQYREAVGPTLDGNLYFNCGVYRAIANREGVSVSREELQLSMAIAKRLIPAVSEKDIIRFFTAVRAYHTGRAAEEHIIEPHPSNPRFINAAFRLPAFNAAPAVAKYEIPQMLGDAGLELTTKPDFNPYRKGIPRFRDLTDEERNKLIARDPKYGHVICRCEHVTEGEVVEAAKRGARTVQDIKFMTRAGMGRCQAGFCRPRVIQILARELDIPVTKVLEREAPVLLYESKELLRKR